MIGDNKKQNRRFHHVFDRILMIYIRDEFCQQFTGFKLINFLWLEDTAPTNLNLIS